MLKLTYKVVALLGVLSLTQSCKINKDYAQTNPYELENYRQEKIETDTTSLADYEWKSFFSDSLLLFYIDEGLANNLDVLKASQSLQITQAYVKQAKAGFLPNVNAGAGVGENVPSINTFSGGGIPEGTNFEDIYLGASLSWEADIWGRIKSQKKAALAQYLQTENVQRLVKSQLVTSIAYNYYLLLALDEKREIVFSSIQNRTEGVSTIKALKEAGTVTEVAVKQNEALLYNAQALLVEIESSIKIIENAFSTLLGRTPQAIPRTNLSEQVFTQDLDVGIPIQLLDNRPDVLAAEYNLVNAFELTNVAHASMYPVLSISAGAGLNSQNFGNLFSLNSLFATVLGNLTQPIFNQRRLKTNKEVAKSKQEIAFWDYKQTILQAYSEVSNALYTYNANTKSLVIKKKENDALVKAIEYSEELQGQGLANYLEVLRAKDNALNTQLSIIDLELTKLQTITNLYQALGGGWK